MSLATRPALPIRVAMFGRSDLADDRVWSLLGQDGQEAGPVEQAEAVNQAGSAVAEHGRSVQALAGNGVDKGVVGGGRVGAGDPEPVGMVAVAALFGDQLSEATGMGGGAGGLLMHRVVLHGGDLFQPVVGDHPDASRLLQQDGRIPQDQVVDGVWLLAEDRDRGRWCAGMVKIAGVGVQRGDVDDRLGEVVGRAVVGLAGEQCQELCPEAAGEPGRAVGTPGSKSAGTEAPSTTTTQPAVAAMKSSLLVASGERREARVTCMASGLLVVVERGDALASDKLTGDRIVLGGDQGGERL